MTYILPQVPDGVIQTAIEESEYTLKTVSPEQQSIHESEEYLSSEAEVTLESIAEKFKSLVPVSAEEKLEVRTIIFLSYWIIEGPAWSIH